LIGHLLLDTTVSTPPYMLGLAAFLTCEIVSYLNDYWTVYHKTYRCQERRVETIRQGRNSPSDTDLIITVNKLIIIKEREKQDDITSSSLM